MKKHIRVFVIVILMLVPFLLSSCNEQEQNNLTPIGLKIEPTITSYKDPEINFDKYYTFSILTTSDLTTESNAILNKQMAFFVRNIFESNGYKYVEKSKNPDMIVLLLAKSQYGETYIPPQIASVPVYIPGTTSTTFNYGYGNVNANAYDNYGNSAYGYGDWNSSGISQTTTPGYVTSQNVVTPAQVVGNYFPTVTVAIYGGKSNKSIWTSTGAGTSDNPDLRISSQMVIFKILNAFPPSHSIKTLAARELLHKAKPAWIGNVGIMIGTIDGNNYYPFIVQISDPMPNIKSSNSNYYGGHNLQFGDMIVSVDGKSTVNRPIIDISNDIMGLPETIVSLEVKRLDQDIIFNITRTEY